MAVYYDSQDKIFTLHTTNTIYQMKVDSYGYLLHLYYGARTMGNMEYLLTYVDRGLSGNPYAVGMDRTYSLDALPQEYPTLGTGDYRVHALNIADDKGTECCNLTFQSYEIRKGKYSLPGLPAVWASEEDADTLRITLRDETGMVEVQLLYGVLEKADIITRAVVIKNTSNGKLTIKKAAAAVLDFVTGDFDVISFYGKHNMERMPQRQPLGHGRFSVGSGRGTSSHQYNPGVILADKETTEDAGSCYGMLLLYSGNFLCEAEKDQYDQTRFLMGLGTEQFDYPLAPGGEFVVPETVLSYSAKGLSGLSHQYHVCIRDHVCRGKYVHASRPVLINSWEAAYFDFNGDTIVNLAKEAAALGIDMVVMDDGWFGRRNDDNSSLGDWTVNEEKLGGTLAQLIDRVHGEGMKFGIWFEPEMVNEDSDLYRAHPDWVIQIPGRKPVRSRNQLVLDFSRKEVRDAIYDQVCAVLDQGEIDYVKWDMNRSLADVYAGNVTYDYVLGLYEFLEKIVARYPNLLIEGCSSGGGRFDAGMMYYTPQIWCSDNTDAINRVKIQYGTSFFYPVSVVGAHVSAVPNHQTGRSVGLNTRGVVAMAGTFGYELNPALLGEEEKAMIKRQVQTYKEYESLICDGTYYRLASPFTKPFAAWMSVSKDKKQALVSVVRLESEGNAASMYVKCKGLNPDAIYLDENTGALYDGASLMAAGLVLPRANSEYEAYQFALKEMDSADELYKKITEIIAQEGQARTVISIFGGSASGKSTLAAALRMRFCQNHVGCYVMTGDDYPRRIPKRNDEERMRVYEEKGVEGLRNYLGTDKEIEFNRINEVVAQFKNGADTIEIKKMGREDGEIWFSDKDFTGISVLIIEWTHGGSPYLHGVDIPVYVESSPEIARKRRIRRGRDENAASPFIDMVVGLEKEKLDEQAKHAKIRV